MRSEEIAETLKAKKITYVSSIKINELARLVLLEIPIEKLRDKVSHEFTSERQAKNLAKFIESQFEYKCQIVWKTGESLKNIENVALTIIQSKFPDTVEELNLSFLDGKTASAYIVTTTLVDEKIKGAIFNTAANALAEFNVECKFIDLIPPANPLPTILQILRSLKICAPATLELLTAHLKTGGFDVPSSKWLSGKIDILRKKDFVLWQENQTYVLTALGLVVLPHSTKRNSSDVDRMLYVARRTTW